LDEVELNKKVTSPKVKNFIPKVFFSLVSSWVFPKEFPEQLFFHQSNDREFFNRQQQWILGNSCA